MQDLVREPIRSLRHSVKARAQAIVSKRLAFLTDDPFLKRGTPAILLEAYGEHFVIFGKVTSVKDFDFTQQVPVEDFTLSEEEVGHLF